jgi:hypothetical protein
MDHLSDRHLIHLQHGGHVLLSCFQNIVNPVNPALLRNVTESLPRLQHSHCNRYEVGLHV